MVMIAHYPVHRKNADQILVVSDGRITEAGTHKELLAKDGKYAAMWNAEQQFRIFDMNRFTNLDANGKYSLE